MNRKHVSTSIIIWTALLVSSGCVASQPDPSETPELASQAESSVSSSDRSLVKSKVLSGDTPEGKFGSLIDDYVVAWSSEDGTLDVEAVRMLYAEDPDLVFL